MALATLWAAVPARASGGSYSGPVYSGGNYIDSIPPGGTSTGQYGGAYGMTLTPGSRPGFRDYGQCSGPITTVFTWQSGPAADPAPQSAIVTQTSHAWYKSFGNPATDTGSCATGITHSTSGFGPADFTDVKYTVESGAAVTMNCTPGAYVETFNLDTCVCGVSYSATISPVAIQIAGAYDPAHGDYRVLTGQQITATLTGIVGTVTKYTWSVSPSQYVFKNYNEKAASNQLTLLGSADLTGPAKGSTSVANLLFYDRKAENLTVTCTASVTAPDGTALSVSATTPQIQVVKPTASWSVDPKTFPINGQTINTGVGFQDNSKKSGSFGATTVWYPVTISVPSPFTGGQGCFAQIATPSGSTTRTPTGIGAATYSIKIPNAQGDWVLPGTGLNQGFPYPQGYAIDASGNITGAAASSAFAAGSIGGSGDAPSGAENPPDVDGGGTNWNSSKLNNQFTTWLMYQPPGGVWVPLQQASWSVSGNATGGPNNWSATGNYTPPSPADTTGFPQWSVIISTVAYRP